MILLVMKKPSSKSSKSKPTPKRPRGRPVTRIIEPIDAPPEAIAKAMFRVADVQRDAQVKRIK